MDKTLLRYNIVSAYMNNQTDESWKLMKAAIRRLDGNESPNADDEDTIRFRNHYKCPECGTEWTDEWSCCCNDECPSCGIKDIQPTHSEEI
jgi:hypothetical protein